MAAKDYSPTLWDLEQRGHDARIEVGADATLDLGLCAEELRGADCVLILADHPEFDYGMVARKGRLIVDTRNTVPGTTGSAGRLPSSDPGCGTSKIVKDSAGTW